MVQEHAVVTERNEVAEGMYVLRFGSTFIARTARPGQFVNVRATAGVTPLLRRPFSICRVEDGCVELVFNVIGAGTRILASKRSGDKLDVLGPLGTPYGFDDSFDTAIMVAGGLGVAPFPFLTQFALSYGKQIESFVGAGTGQKLWSEHLRNVHPATDDGSKGFRGTVVAHLDEFLQKERVKNPKIFGCGPTKMLQSLSELAKRHDIECEL